MQYQPPVGAGDNEPYVTGNESTGTDGSIPSGSAIEHPQRELISIIEAGGLDPSESDLGQAQQSIALQISNAVAVAGGFSVGDYIFRSSSSVPVGFLECDGSSLLRADYPELFSVIGVLYGSGDSLDFLLPDFRGEFVRGWDNGRGVDDGRLLGSFQSGRMPAHTHSDVTVQTGSSVQVSRGGVDFGSVTQDVRVRNLSAMVCIKY